MSRKYLLEIVKGDKIISIPESSSIDSQRIQEAKWDLMHGRMTSDAQEVAKYGLTATNPLALMKRKKRKLERQNPNPDTLFAKERARAERDPNYSIVITDPRGARKSGSNISS